MALTNSTLSERAYDRLTKGFPQAAAGIQQSALVTMIGDALQQLAERTAASHNANLLENTYTVTLASGAANLTGLDGGGLSLDQVLTETVAHEQVTMSGETNPLSWVPNKFGLRYPPIRNVGLKYFTVTKRTIEVVTDTGAAVTGTPTVTFVANFIPAISEVPVPLEEDLVEILVEIARGAVQRQIASTGNEEPAVVQ